jgi:hypothetical protein
VFIPAHCRLLLGSPSTPIVNIPSRPFFLPTVGSSSAHHHCPLAAHCPLPAPVANYFSCAVPLPSTLVLPLLIISFSQLYQCLVSNPAVDFQRPSSLAPITIRPSPLLSAVPRLSDTSTHQSHRLSRSLYQYRLSAPITNDPPPCPFAHWHSTHSLSSCRTF